MITKNCNHSFATTRFWWTAFLPLFLVLDKVCAEPRSLFIWGPLSTEYVTETAQFGNPIDEPLSANLMLPPDDPWLCEFPPSFENLTETDVALLPQFSELDQDVALFVSVNECSAETKARVALQLQQRISYRVKLLVLYSSNSQEFNFVSLASDDGDNPEDLRSIGVVYIPQRYASGIDLRMRMQYQGDDPRFGYDGSEHWSFPIEVTALSDNVRYRGGDGPGYNGGDIYWFRIILFSLLIASPCCRACYLWYAGGGRLHWRRNEEGRIVGIQYIPPMPLWLSTGRPANDGPMPVGVLTEDEFNNLPEIIYKGVPGNDDDGSEDDIDEIDNSHDNNQNSNQPTAGDTDEDNSRTSDNVEVQSGSESNDRAHSKEDETKSPHVDVEAGDGIQINTDGNERFQADVLKDEEFLNDKETLNANVTTKDVGTSLDHDNDFLEADSTLGTGQATTLTKSSKGELCLESKIKSAADEETQDDENDFNAKATSSEMQSRPGMEESVDDLETHTKSDKEWPESTEEENSVNTSLDAEVKGKESIVSLNDNSPERSGANNEESGSPVNDTANVEDESSTAEERETTSTACAICIDEFETGERLTLLPRCKHAFHRECIHAWLIERQGCCPLCKTDVLEPDPDNSPGELDLEAPPEQRFMISSM